MSITDADIAFVTDLFSDIGKITTRKMFGGMGIYCDGTIFALQTKDGIIMIKAKDDLAAELAGQGCQQFGQDHTKNKKANMPYWTLPGDALDDPDLACSWARKSLTQNA